ncbi:MAG: hypothetical protein GWO11_05940 [Desulfuromonadales bacterium]|nr:hypothetical protein [Desulfuromonadales bacterium]NIR33916.1 hypothetical protein [Desulfuromonadales bacterium]NIS43914.1 hypothetical protein [Desulfuromonadales bacterium]
MTAGLYLLAFAADPDKAVAAAQTALRTFGSVFLLVVAVMGLVGLVQVWISREMVARLLGREGGLRALVLAAVCGTMLIGPAYILFPLLMSIRTYGARWAVVVTVLAAYAVKVPMIPLEMEFLGWPFSLLRLGLTLATAIPLGLAVEAVMVKEGS